MAIKQLTPHQSKQALAKQLGVSRQSLYYQPKMPAKDLALKAEIEAVMANNKAYGHKRIAWHLVINKKRALRVMKMFGLKPLRKRRAFKKPQDIGQEPMTIPNLVKGIIIDAPHQVWASDFTYLPYFGKFIYQTQHKQQRKIMNLEALRLDYYLKRHANALKEYLREGNFTPIIGKIIALFGIINLIPPICGNRKMGVL